MFGASFQEHNLGKVWWWKFPKLLKDAARDHSILIVTVNRFEARSAETAGAHLLFPNWVSGEVAIPLSPAILNSRSVRSDFKKIAEHKLSYEVTKDPKRLEEFYRDMHVPYTRVAHGDFARIESCEELQQRFKDWDLLLVKNEAEYIAGQLITYEESGPRFYLIGIRDGNREYLKQRVLGAVYQFSIRHLVEKGFHRAGLGYSRAFLNDGVLRYKQKLSQQITGSSAEGLALTVWSYTPATREFLAEQSIHHPGWGRPLRDDIRKCERHNSPRPKNAR